LAHVNSIAKRSTVDREKVEAQYHGGVLKISVAKLPVVETISVCPQVAVGGKGEACKAGCLVAICYPKRRSIASAASTPFTAAKMIPREWPDASPAT